MSDPRPAMTLTDVMDSFAYTPPPIETALRTCVGCNQDLPASEFYTCPTRRDGLQIRCKQCYCEHIRSYRATKRPVAAVDASMDEPLQETQAEATGDYLYVLRNPLIPGMVKIGRAFCPTSRARQLSASQPFELLVCHCYAGYGHLEKTLHDKLKMLRIVGGRGREWFAIEPWQADALINAAIVEFGLNL